MTIEKNSLFWCSVKFTDVLDVQGGTQPPKSQFISEPSDGYVRLLQIRDFGKKPVPTFIPDTTKIKKCIKRDVLIGRYGASLGRICTGMEGAYNVALAKVLITSGVVVEYVKYYLLSEEFQNPLRLLSRSAQNGFNKDDLSRFDFNLAPLAEQKKIATKLDELLAQVDTIKTRLDAIPNILKRFRQSVLAAAVSGKLTEDWRNEIDTKNGYPASWSRKGFLDIGELSRGKSKHRPRKDPKLFGNKYPFIQTGEVANSDGRIYSANKFYSDFGLQQSKLFPKGTLCITIAANIADTAILDIDACFPDSIVGFVAFKEECVVEFIKYLVDVNKNNLEEFAPATAQKNINLKILNELSFPLPTIKEQSEIVRRVEEFTTFADQIEQRVKEAQTRVNNLTQSILAKAFRGELTAEWREKNPDLISGENSAEALLEKIKKEREAIEKAKPKKKKPKHSTKKKCE